MWLYRLFGRLPLAALYPVASILALCMRRLYRSRLVADNLRQALPHRSQPDRDAIARRFYRNVADVAVETLKAPHMTESDFAERVRLTNPEVFDQYRARGQSVMLLGAHQANWEWFLLACSLALPMPLEVIYRPLHSASFDRFTTASRRRFGARLVLERDAIKEVMARHKELRVVAMMADQRPARKEPRAWIRFLEQDTAFHTGWAKLAQFTKYPIWYAHCARVERGRYEVTFRCIAEPPFPRRVDALVETLAGALEQSILEDPSVWLWSHERWREAKPLYD